MIAKIFFIIGFLALLLFIFFNYYRIYLLKKIKRGSFDRNFFEDMRYFVPVLLDSADFNKDSFDRVIEYNKTIRYMYILFIVTFISIFISLFLL